jgi:hypothetical protein
MLQTSSALLPDSVLNPSLSGNKQANHLLLHKPPVAAQGTARNNVKHPISGVRT